MTPDNFNWFLHTLLFLHTEQIIMVQKEKSAREANESEEEEVGIDIDRE